MIVHIATLLVLAASLVCSQARAEELVTSLSSNMVSIQSNFTGTEIVVFGQIIRDAHTVARPGNYDLAIAIEGPKQDVTTRRKKRFLGVWINRYYEMFKGVPSFYALATTKRAGELGDRSILDENGIGLNHLNLPVSGHSRVPLSDRDDFRKAFLRLRQEEGLYSERPETIEFLTATMFRTSIPLPANIPVGNYKVKSYLFQDGILLSKQEAELAVAKIGFEQLTYNLAQNQPFIYGLMAVLIAIFTGWLAGVIFRKD
ncbi:TIGR02186 family protein [Roseibium algae]|uniref:TIGR02186 family protein n=1 Tax=Roseibium algae TaxID=3123038 RepID=A0ABU8THX3_9HYPH